MMADGESPQAIQARVAQNSALFLGNSLFNAAVNGLRSAVLALLLLPADFGLYNLAFTVIGFTVFFSDVGAGIFLLYRDRADTEAAARQAFWVNLVVATAIAAGIAALSPLLAAAYDAPLLTPVLVVTAAATWATAAVAVHRNLLRKSLRFRPILAAQTGLTLVSFASGVALAWAGYGVWSFVLSLLLGGVASGLILLRATGWWLPAWSFDRVLAGQLFRFSRSFVLAGVVWYVAISGVNLLLGKFAGIEALGVYTLAATYAMLPITMVANALGQVVMPELGNLQRDTPRLWETYHHAGRLLVLAAAGIAAALIAAAPDVFPLVFGPTWSGAILPFQVLLVYVVVRSLWMDPFAAVGRFDLAVKVGAVAAVATVGAAWVALPRVPASDAGLVVALLILGIVGAAHVGALAVVAPDQLRRGLGQAAPCAAAGVLALGAAWAAREVFVGALGVRPAVLVALDLGVAAGVYAALRWDSLAELLRTLLPSGRAEVPAEEAG